MYVYLQLSDSFCDRKNITIPTCLSVIPTLITSKHLTPITSNVNTFSQLGFMMHKTVILEFSYIL